VARCNCTLDYGQGSQERKARHYHKDPNSSINWVHTYAFLSVKVRAAGRFLHLATGIGLREVVKKEFYFLLPGCNMSDGLRRSSPQDFKCPLSDGPRHGGLTICFSGYEDGH
jgi:hypothetical protein